MNHSLTAAGMFWNISEVLAKGFEREKKGSDSDEGFATN